MREHLSRMDVRILLLLFLLVSCLPQSQVGSGNLSSDNNTSTTAGAGSGNISIPESATNWNYLGKLSKTITINVSNLQNSYIAGSNIEKFLAIAPNYSEDYCLVSRFIVGGITKEVRSRVVPVSYYDFTAKRTVRIFRVDFPDVSTADDECDLTLKVLDNSGNLVTETPAVASNFNPGQICSTCTSVLTSNKIKLYQATPKAQRSIFTPVELRELSLTQVDISGLILGIDPNNTTVSNPGTCSQSSCASRGFDCCLDNQCVNDGSIRPSAQTQYSTQLASAEQERLSNPLAYLNYPQLYYICGTSVPTTTGGSSSGGTYEPGLTQLQKDYYCIEHIKKFKESDTFHFDLISGTFNFPDDPDIADVTNSPTTLYPLDIECRNDTAPSSTMNYKEVAKRLYQNCGCSRTTLDEMVTLCPKYDYTVNRFLPNGLPERIECFTPPGDFNTIPQTQSVTVNSRSAPHRYFRKCGTERGASGACSDESQEGDTFQYQDTSNLLPVAEPFGMNSIIGPMNVTLDKALPAKMVPVELDQVYQISTTSGFYSPCPTCGKDSWFSSFSAFPTTAYGTGLQAVGFSTERDTFGNNTTAGNYEDTIFGRACWIPPTMIPFSHREISGTQNQRLNRLKTQAAMFANGYQRDWYGFNKGALIGSFDGVTWFAVGKGRIVKSTSKKLFLAINAPFADLASPTLHVVNVQAYDGITQAATMDYDPQYHLSHPYQNEAGACQVHHLCETDTECVTRLGWEYMCADTKDLKTKWPTFDANGDEVGSSSVTLTLDKILLQKKYPSSSTKRCVYRGAGALCMPDITSIADVNKRKTLACAPNFYCANATTAGAVFNNKISRYASLLEDIPVARNHLYGKDANVLGRPLSYVASSLTTTLPTDITTTLNQNLLTYESTANNKTGLCRPGKALPEASNQTLLRSPYEQHKTHDISGRTDYINQIASCNSGLYSGNRYASCPVMNSSGNYEMFSTSFNVSTWSTQARLQNTCGLDTLLTGITPSGTTDSLAAYSPFKYIEARTLAAQTVATPSLVRDACLRRANQVCHTDLDCSPNKMHADQSENFTMAYFGNAAEKTYYQEYLSCSQLDPKPMPTDILAYRNYKMHQNRCCREVGLSLTTYTSNTPTSIDGNAYDPVTANLTYTTPGLAPSAATRYSRLATVDDLGGTKPFLSAYQKRGTGININEVDSAITPNVKTSKQWMTLSEANSESCCGGGWIRKFSDGTNDWTKRDRAYYDVTNFRCLNSRTVMLTKPEDVASQYNSAADAMNLVNEDMGDYCKDALGVKGYCAQYSFIQDSTEFAPSADAYMGRRYDFGADTNLQSHYSSFKNERALPSGGFHEKEYYFYPRSADGDKRVIIDHSSATGRRNIQIRLPSFITRAWDNHVDALPQQGPIVGGPRVVLFNIDNEAESRECEKVSTVDNLPSPTANDSGNAYCNSIVVHLGSVTGCCYWYDKSTRILKVINDLDAGPAWLQAGAAGQNRKFAVKLIDADPAGRNLITRFKPGSSLYHLKRLGKLELSGIPQITYEGMYCSDNHDRVLPGIFKHSNPDMKRVDFENANYSFNDVVTVGSSTYTKKHVNHLALQNEPIFSASEFKCCIPLGKTTTEPTKCCSGYATGAAQVKTCELPLGTDLMVYFNRFVSNEGIGTTQPGGGLVDADFDNKTGEPRVDTLVTQKIALLGRAYCESKKVRIGGAFGEFPLEPEGNDTNQNELIYNIVDSSKDEGQLTSSGGNAIQVGYTKFMQGFRWNHHLYCDE
jgi:hypothetical protein